MKSRIKFLSVIIFILGALNLTRVDFLVLQAKSAGCDDLEGDEKIACEEEKDEKEEEAEDLEKELKKAQESAERAKQNLGQVQGAVYTTQKAINTTQSQIDEAGNKIKEKEEVLEDLEKSIERKKIALEKMMQENYFNSDQPWLFSVFSRESFLEMVSNIDNSLRIKEEVLVLVKDIKEDKESIKNETEDLSLTKEEKEELLEIKESQKQALEREASGLEEVVAKREATVQEIQTELNDLRNDLNKLLGKSFDTNDVKDAIKFASKMTGVDKGFLFGMLSVESRLGSYVGGCTYKQSRMSGTRAEIFKDICAELDYDYKKKKVSCPPSSYKGTGGAMGAAQFMPDTWRAYEKKISSATGHDPADPWNLVDGVMAMALKLENDGATKDGKTTITSPCSGRKVKISWEDYAAMKYLGWSCYALTNYAPTIQSLSGNYDQL